MTGYTPLKVTGNKTGLVQSRQNFILPNDAYPILENALVYRERIERKQGWQIQGRLRRILTAVSQSNTNVSPFYQTSLYASVSTATEDPEVEPGSVLLRIDVGGGSQSIYKDIDPVTGDVTPTIMNYISGPFTLVSPGTVDYVSGDINLELTVNPGIVPVNADFNYFPNLPAMTIATRELNTLNIEQTVVWDTKYAYIFTSGYQEFVTGTTWTGSDSDFFWTTNYWTGITAQRIFWATNFTLTDPIRYTNGTSWVTFAPQIDSAGNLLEQCLALLPFRGRMVTFNTLEGLTLGSAVSYPQRIRWAAIGNPFTTVSAIVTTVNANAWRDDIRGQGGYLDIPTTQAIVAVGFVRDNLVIYCERSTWQLKYTGQAIAPFQIEKVNSELGTESTYSAVQFDTSLVGIGDKGIVECDSFSSRRIDIKIPDLVFSFSNNAAGTYRIQGVRDFQKWVAYWIYPYQPGSAAPVIYPNRRLVYNYENDSWAIYTDSLTCLGTFQPTSDRTWQNTDTDWIGCDFSWDNRPQNFPAIIGGNQQGFVFYLNSQAFNAPSLRIKAITGNVLTPTVIESPSHNLQTNDVIKITGIAEGSPFSGLNDEKFGVVWVDVNTFQLWKYDSQSGDFTTPQLNSDSPGGYLGGAVISVRDNFRIVSKQFNYLDEGQNIQLGGIDLLMNTTTSGAITLNIYLDYNNAEPVNSLPQNSSNDTFFNQIIPTINHGGLAGTKAWQKVYCAERGAFITLEYTLSNAQMVGIEQESNVQIDAQVLWVRKAGLMQTSGV